MKTRLELTLLAREIAKETVTLLRERNWHDEADKVAGLRIEWNTRFTSSAGRATYSRNLVELSWPVFKVEENQHGFRNTVLHEIAHHLAPYDGHGRKWRNIFMMLGGNGARCHKFKVQSRKTRARTPVKCNGCSIVHSVGPVQMKRIQQGRKYRCARCGYSLVASMALQNS